MKERMRTTLVLMVLVVATALSAHQQQIQRTDLVYAESLDKVALVVDGEELTLRDMAVYVAYQEKKVQQDALVYNSEKPEKYWNAYTNQHFVRSVAENAVKDMAAHDEIFYQMAVTEGLELDEAEIAFLENEITDFFMDISEAQMARLGVQKQDIESAMQKIALANKYQSILAQIEGLEYEAYDYTGEAYMEYVESHEIEEKEQVWDRISVGNITVNYKKKSAEKSETAKDEWKET